MPDVIDQTQPLSWKIRVRRSLSKLATNLAFFSIITLILIAVLWQNIIYTIPPGSLGVVWLRFLGGTVTDKFRSEGITAIFPWDKLYIYDGRPQRVDLVVPALTVQGLTVKISVTVTVVVNPESIGVLHKSIGPNYLNLIIEPTVASAIRTMVAGYKIDDIYDMAHHEIEAQLMRQINDRIISKQLNFDANEELVQLTQVSLRVVELPPEIVKAIEEKLSAEQAALRYQYILRREELETQRKEIEALGIKRFQEIVTPTISESYLRWRGIDATLQLALSPNSKVVVIGGSQGGLPLIFDSRGEGLTPQQTAPAQIIPPQAAQHQPSPTPVMPLPATANPKTP
ncbi:MAG: prohibitin family protein [Rhodospirillaceae bacterium]|nr:prohibitin family protein [Rhodospirillales bacterium]